MENQPAGRHQIMTLSRYERLLDLCGVDTPGVIIQCSGTTHLLRYLPDETVTATDATYSSGATRSELDEYPVVLDDQPQ